MLIYYFDVTTHEYLKTDTADEYKTHPVIPANATSVSPVFEYSANEIPVWNFVEWVITKDYRGKKYFNVGSQTVSIVTKLGELEDGCYLISDEDIAKISDNVYITYVNDNFVFTDNSISKKDTYSLNGDELTSVIYYIETLTDVPDTITKIVTELKTIKTTIDSETSSES